MVVKALLGARDPGGAGVDTPDFSVRVSGGEIPLGVRQLVERVEYESADGYADMLKVVLWDPDIIPPKNAPRIGATGGLGSLSGGSGGSGGHQRLVDTKIFQPGNEITLALGYGAELRHVGRGVIRKMRPTFPSQGVPTIEVTAYTADVKMMDNAPARSKKKKGKGGRRFKDSKFSDAVRDRGSDYGFDLDVDDTPEAPHDFMHVAGLTDYDFVNGLANITGYVFWVDGDQDGTWTLHFKNPDVLRKSDIQDRTYTFKYNDGNYSSLLSFEPEILLSGSVTELQVQVKNPRNGKLMVATIKEENDKAPEVLVSVSRDTLRAVDQALGLEHTTASDIKLFINDFSFEARANRTFANEAELVAWARQWFRRQRENFIMGRGATIGTEHLMARQTHRLEGLGPTLTSDYYFSRVRHILDNTNGYVCDFNCRKYVPPLP